MPKKLGRFYQRPKFWLMALLTILLLFGLYRCLSNSAKPKDIKSKAILVKFAYAKTMDIPISISALGTVTPITTVNLKSQITGTLQTQFFRDGQMVKKGDVLIQIDPRPYLAQLAQYQGQLLRDQALLANALIDLRRYQTLWKQNAISQQTLATQQALVKQYQGDIQMDQGLIVATQLNIEYCRILSPVSGRIGLALIDPGNVVQISDTTALAVITQLDPIQIVFAIPEDSLSDVQQKILSGVKLKVEAYDRQQIKLLAMGEVSALDSQIDPTTGTVKVQADFKNDKYLLFPNQFVNVRLHVTTLKNAIVIPTESIQFSPDKNIVYVIQPNKTVAMRIVKTGPTSGQFTIVHSGLAVGTAVVTEGTDKLVDGSKIIISTAQKKKVAKIKKVTVK